MLVIFIMFVIVSMLLVDCGLSLVLVVVWFVNVYMLLIVR